MAQQITNTFLKSKMNKDLDDRILPNGEYRDARNISVGRSEDNDVGALENIIGNNLIASTDIGNGFTIIGVLGNNSTDEIFVFLTNYTDPSPTNPTNAPSSSKHYIYVYNNNTSSYNLLVEGEFLNFSTTNRIIGINLIENLLFWTDNRNQPRKINIGLETVSSQGSRSSSSTSQSYYTQEHQISVAKYNPYQAIQLYNRINLVVSLGATAYFQVAGDQVAAITPFIGATVVSAEQTAAITGLSHIKVIGVNLVGGDTRVTISPAFPVVPAVGTYVSLIISTMTNKTGDDTWPGDPDYLEDRFVRFSYRFKYDDNEYSLMAPFTQIAYIPKQGGFFINGDEDAAYQSTIVNFMENNVQNIGLVIPLPTNANRIVRDYKISEVEILFRESDAVAVKVLESITSGEISGASGISNYYTYDYQSRKPYKTLPEAQTVRVYDKVPVRAFAQESSGNRIIYGNYRDQHTPPSSINYNCKITPKSSTGTFNNWIEYPNHSVKRNRNYQIGFVLADKFGRQSPVILSSVDNGIIDGGQFYFGSTIYSPYDITATDTSVKDWFGDAIMVLVNSEITSTKNLAEGTPGLYALKQKAGSGAGDGFAINGNAAIVNDSTYTFSLNSASFPNNNHIPNIGDYMRGAYEDFVKVENRTGPSGGGQTYTVTTSGRVSDVYLRTDNLPANTPDLKFAYNINDLGWYSYKIVVKQTEQEYYNVYLPGILNGYPGQSGNANDINAPSTFKSGGFENGLFPTDETNVTAFTVLFNDNINKIPRDLAEVGPDQKQYRSSVTLFGRVTNLMTTPVATSTPYNSQYYARINSEGKTAISHTSTAIARAKEVNMGYADLSNGTNDENCSTNSPQDCLNTGGARGNKVFYQIDTNPLIARISTIDKPIGATALNEFAASNINIPLGTANMLPYLAIYETEPVESLLDIYWETTSEGLIVDLNADVLTGAGGATSFKDVTWVFDETTAAGTFVTTQYFEPLDVEGNPFGAPVLRFELVGQTDGNGNPVELFERVLGSGSTAGKAKLRFLGDANGQPLVFNAASRELNVYTFVFEIETADGNTSQLTLEGQIGGFGALKNIAPSFSTISPIAITNIDSVVLPASAWSSAVNGAASTTTDANKIGLIYLMEAISGEINPITDYGWEIDETNGQITQPVPPAPGTPIPNGIYKVKVILQDAYNVGGVEGDYSFLSQQQEITITIGYPVVNPEALSNVCTLGIASITPSKTQGPYTELDITPLQAITSPPSLAELSSGSQIGPPASGFWYVGDQTTTTQALIDSIYDISNGIFNGIFDVVNDSGGGEGRKYNKLYKIRDTAGRAHSKGTLMFTINIEASAGAPPSQSTSQYFLKGVKFYYRKKDSNGLYEAWAPIQWNQEYNNALSLDPNLGQWPTLFSDSAPAVARQVNTELWLQYVKAFDKSDFDTNQNSNDVEYLIVLDDISENNGTLGNTKPLAWVTATDTHYPTCLVWQGKNAATTSSAGTYSYQYSASAPSDQATAVLSPLNVTLYGDNPLGDYVNNFYTDASLSTVYSPPSGTPFINYTLNTSNFSSALDVWKLGGNSFNLQWTVQLDSNGGERIDGIQFERTKAAIVGLYTGTTGEAFPTGPEGGGFFKGTTRIYQNL